MKNLIQALVKAQSQFKPVSKNKTNPMFKSKYADLESIISAVRPILNANGLFMRQIVGNGENCVTVETIISHVEGAELSSGVLSIPVNFGKGVGAQAVGSAITYAKRYSLCAFLGIAADEDDDGNSANLERPNSYTPPARQAPRPAPKPADAPSPADIADDAAIGLHEEVAEYKARIVEAENMDDLNAIAEELKVCNFPKAATQAIRTVWANKKKEFV